MHLIGNLYAIGAGIFFGFITPTTKLAYQFGVGLSFAILLRYFLASLVIAVPLIIKIPKLTLFTTNLKLFLLISLGSICLTIGLLASVMYIQISLAILIFYTYPLLVLFTSIVIDKEKIDSLRIFLFFLAFVGIVFVLAPSFKSVNLLGLSFAFLASIGAATMIITNQKMSKLLIHPIYINAFTNFSNLIFFTIVIFLFYDFPLPTTFNGWIFITIASLCYIVAYLLQLVAIPRIGQSRTALLLYAEPIVAIISAIYLLNDLLNIYQIFGAILVISSLAYATYNKK